MGTPNKKGAARQGTPPKVSSTHDDSRMAFSMREVADAIGMSERSIWSLIASGRLRAIKLGRSVRIPRESLAELLGGAK